MAPYHTNQIGNNKKVWRNQLSSNIVKRNSRGVNWCNHLGRRVLATLIKLKMYIPYSLVGKVAEDMQYTASLHQVLDQKNHTYIMYKYIHSR